MPYYANSIDGNCIYLNGVAAIPFVEVFLIFYLRTYLLCTIVLIIEDTVDCTKTFLQHSTPVGHFEYCLELIQTLYISFKL